MYESFLGVNPWTALFILLNTLTIWFVAKKYLFAPVTNIITERQTEIERQYAGASAAKGEAEQLRKAYQAKLSDAQNTSERIVKDAIARGHAREEEIIRNAKEKAAAIMAKASMEIDQEKKKALNDAKDEISEIAMVIAVKAVGKALTANDHKRLVDSFIDELGDPL